MAEAARINLGNNVGHSRKQFHILRKGVFVEGRGKDFGLSLYRSQRILQEKDLTLSGPALKMVRRSWLREGQQEWKFGADDAQRVFDCLHISRRKGCVNLVIAH